MRRKAYPVAQLTGGLDVNLDAVFLTDKMSPNLTMVRFDKGLVKKDVGFSAFGTGERVLNGDMEYDGHWANVGTPANNIQSNAQAHGGTYSRLIVANAANQGVQSANFCAAANANYTMSVWVRANTAVKATATVLKANGASNDAVNSANLAANTWTQLSASYTASVSGNNAALQVIANVACNLYVDDATITCSNPTDERIVNLYNLTKVDGASYFIALTPTRVYWYDSGVWKPVDGSNVFTGTAEDRFSCSIFNDYLIITNSYNTVKKWGGGTVELLGGLSAIQLTSAKTVITYNSRVILGATVEGGTSCPYRIRWGATGQLEQWDPATYPDAGFVDLVDTPDWVIGLVVLVDRLFVFKERSIWELLPTKDAQVFEVRMVVDRVGAYSESTVVSLGDALLFFGTDNVYLFDGSALKPVGTKLFPWLYTTGEKRVNLERLARTASTYIEELGEYVLCLPTIGDDPDWLIRYNVKEGSWTQRDLAITAFGSWPQIDFEDWSESTGYWDNSRYNVSWASGMLPPGAPITILGQANGTILRDDRLQTSTDLMVWETKDFIFGQAERVVAVSLRCRGSGDFTMQYSVDQGRTWESGQTFTPDSQDFQEEKRFFNETCDHIRFRVKTQATDFQIMWIEPWYIDRARTTSPSTS